MYFRISENPQSPIVCNIPHASIAIPDEFRGEFFLDAQALNHETSLMADNYTDMLYDELLLFSSSVISNISRIVVDIERFEREADEPMSKVGMSAFYTRTSTGNELRAISPEHREKLEAIYHDYHRALADIVRMARNRHGIVLIVDCHSFPSIPRSYEPSQAVPRPDICIGTDAFHTPSILKTLLCENFQKLGYSVGINTPFAGSIVPMEFYRVDTKVISVMIEVNRKLYMDEPTFQRKQKDFPRIGKDITHCIIKSLNQFIPHP